MTRRIKLFLINILDFFKIIRIVKWKDLPAYFFTSYLYGPEKLIGISINNLNGEKVYVRRGNIIDRDVIKYVFYHQYHLPLQPIPDQGTIIDLGSNIGLTLVHYKSLYSAAKVLGYEMDKENFEIALKNTAKLTGCSVFNNAVWTGITQVRYAGNECADAYHILDNHSSSPIPENKLKTAQAVTLNSIILEHDLKRIDYLKMDIEGAEKEILKEPSFNWLDLVQELNIEMHDDIFFDEAIVILQTRGFTCQRDKLHPRLLRAIRR